MISSNHLQSTYLILFDDGIPYPLSLLFISPNGLEVLLRSLAPFHVQI